MQLTRTIRKVALTDSFQNLPQGKAVRRISLLAPVPSLKPPGQLPQVWVGTFVSELHPSPGSLETQAFLHRHNWYIASAAEALKSRSVKEYKTLEMKAKYFKEKGGGGVCVYLAVYKFSNIVHKSGGSPIIIRKLMLRVLHLLMCN